MSLPKAATLTEILSSTDSSLRAEDQAAIAARRAEKTAEREKKEAQFNRELREWHERRAAGINLVNLCRLHARRDTVTDNDSQQLAMIETAMEAIVNPALERVTPIGFEHEKTRAEVFSLAAVAQALSDHTLPEEQPGD